MIGLTCGIVSLWEAYTVLYEAKCMMLRNMHLVQQREMVPG